MRICSTVLMKYELNQSSAIGIAMNMFFLLILLSFTGSVFSSGAVALCKPIHTSYREPTVCRQWRRTDIYCDYIVLRSTFGIYLFEKKFDKAIALISKKDALENISRRASYYFLERSRMSGNLSVLKAVLTSNHLFLFSCIISDVLSRAVVNSELPIIRRLCWELLIVEATFDRDCHSELLQLPQEKINQKVRSGVYDPISWIIKKERAVQESVNYIESFFESVNWDDPRGAALDIAGSLRLHEAIETFSPGNVLKALKRVTPCEMGDEYEELPLDKAVRLEFREGAEIIGLFIKFKERIFDEIAKVKIQNAQPSQLKDGENPKALVKGLLKKCPTLSSRFIRDIDGNTILHAAVKTGDPDLVLFVLCMNPKLIAIVNNSGLSPLITYNSKIKDVFIEFITKVPDTQLALEYIVSCTTSPLKYFQQSAQECVIC